MKWIMAMVAVLALPGLAFGAASMTLTEHGGSATTAEIGTLAGTIVIDLNVDFDDTLGCDGFNLALRETTGTVFEVTARSSPLTDFSPMTADGTLLDYAVEDIFSMGNLGGERSSAGTWAHTGSDQVFLELTLSYPAGLTLGNTYTINPGRTNKVIATTVSVKDNTGLVDQTPLGLNGIDITVVPEPASMLLMVGALPFLRRRRSA